MSEFKNVSVVKKANVYFNGKVVSRTIRLADGSVKTLGFMQTGDYEFNTDAPELMEILSGRCLVQLSTASGSIEVQAGQSFNVPGKSKFKIKVLVPTDYCCSFE